MCVNCCAAGGILLEAGARAELKRTTITNCSARLGGGVCAECNYNAKEDGIADLYGGTNVIVNASFSGNYGLDLVAGPFFNLTFENPSVINSSSVGVVWHKKSCEIGEDFVDALGYCEPCRPFTFSAVAGAEGKQNCTQAPSSNARARGGAVLVPLDGNYQGAPVEMLVCTGCLNFTGDYTNINRCVASNE